MTTTSTAITDISTTSTEHCVKQPKNAKYDSTTDRKGNNHLSIVSDTSHRKAKSTRTTPTRPKNKDVRTREHLTEGEVARIRDAAKDTRNGFRDQLIVMMMYRHGLRVAELIDMRWEQIDFENARLYVKRVKGSESGVHPVQGDELRMLRKLQRERKYQSPWVFVSERKGPLSARSIQTMIANAGKDAGLGEHVHPHQLRHACGYELANKYDNTRLVQDWLGHRNIQNTVVYTKLSDRKFAGVKLGG